MIVLAHAARLIFRSVQTHIDAVRSALRPTSVVRTTIIIPLHNAAETLATTLASVIAQTDPNWQTLLVVDRSTDATLEICAEHAARDARFRVIQSTGAGVSAARNTGMRQASGARLLFLDGDDRLDPQCLNALNRKLDMTRGASAAYCGYRRLLSDGRSGPVYQDPGLERELGQRFSIGNTVAIHSVLIRREAAESCGGFDVDLKTCEDWDFWWRAVEGKVRWAHVPDVVNDYVVRKDAATQDLGQMLRDASTVAERIEAARALSPHLIERARPAYGRFALWCAAIACGQGRAFQLDAKTLADIAAWLDNSQEAADLIIDGLMVGSRALPEDIAGLWPDIAPLVLALLETVANYPATAAYADVLRHRLAQRLGVSVDVEDAVTTARAQGSNAQLQDLISIIVPAYNAQGTIRETLHSLTTQSHDNLEIIVVDDGSIDQTIAIVEQMATTDPRIRVLSQSNAGVAAARNAGWRASKGAYVGFVDADDLNSETKFELLLRALVRGGPRVGLAYGWTASIDMQSRITGHHPRFKFSGNVLPDILRNNFLSNGSSILVRRGVLIETGGYDSNLHLRGAQGCEDYLFYCQAAGLYDYAVVPEYLTGYRYVPDNMSSNRPRMIRSLILAKFILTENHPERIAYIDEFVWRYATSLMKDAIDSNDILQCLSIAAIMFRLHPGDGILAVMRVCLRVARGKANRLRSLVQSRDKPGVAETFRIGRTAS